MEASARTSRPSDGEPDGWDAIRLAHEWLLMDPPQVAELAAGRHVGAALADRVAGRVRQFRRLAESVATHVQSLMQAGDRG